MFALISLSDSSFYVVPTQKIIKSKSKGYKNSVLINGQRTTFTVEARGKQELMLEMRNNLAQNMPHVLLQRVQQQSPQPVEPPEQSVTRPRQVEKTLQQPAELCGQSAEPPKQAAEPPRQTEELCRQPAETPEESVKSPIQVEELPRLPILCGQSAEPPKQAAEPPRQTQELSRQPAETPEESVKSPIQVEKLPGELCQQPAEPPEDVVKSPQLAPESPQQAAEPRRQAEDLPRRTVESPDERQAMNSLKSPKTPQRSPEKLSTCPETPRKRNQQQVELSTELTQICDENGNHHGLTKIINQATSVSHRIDENGNALGSRESLPGEESVESKLEAMFSDQLVDHRTPHLQSDEENGNALGSKKPLSHGSSAENNLEAELPDKLVICRSLQQEIDKENSNIVESSGTPPDVSLLEHFGNTIFSRREHILEGTFAIDIDTAQSQEGPPESPNESDRDKSLAIEDSQLEPGNGEETFRVNPRVALFSSLESQSHTAQSTMTEIDVSTDPDFDPKASSSFVSDNASKIATDLAEEQTESEDSSSSKSSHETDGQGCNDELLHVVGSKDPVTKKQNCVFCNKLQAKLARHLILKHPNEEKVKAFRFLSKDDPSRKKLIAELRKTGNFNYNTKPDLNKGDLIVCRRPNPKRKKTAQDYICCANCKGFFTKNNLRHHYKQCKGSVKHRAVCVLGRKAAGRLHPRASQTLRRVVFPVLRDDEVTRQIRFDRLIIIYGNKMCARYSKHQHQHDMIRARLRLLGRFLLAMKEINKDVQDFASIFDPKFYDNCVEAVNVTARFDPKTGNYGAPAVASGLGTHLKQAAQILVSECIKDHDDENKVNAENFLKLMAEDYGTTVNKVVEETQTKNKREKKVVLPSTDDIKKLHEFLATRRRTNYEKLKKKFDYDTWLDLAKATLISAQVFNRRRAGELERVLIEDFKRYESINEKTHKDLYESLSAEAQQLARKYVRFEIRGKLNRTVPVLLYADLLECINLILEHREAANIPKDNPYLFGLPSSDKDRHKYLRACELMRQYSHECGADIPNALRGTELRKHIATRCITLNLSENEVTDLANFMGHAEKVHKDHYRQPVISREILRMSKLLEVAQGNEENVDDADEWHEKDVGDVPHSTTGPSKKEARKRGRPRGSTNQKKTRQKDISTKEPASKGSKPSNKVMGKKTGLKCQKGENTSVNRPQCSYESDEGSEASSWHSDASGPPAKRTKRSDSHQPQKRTRWTDEEKAVVLKCFKTDLSASTLPSLTEIQRVINSIPCLHSRTAAQVKTWIHNIVSGKTKLPATTKKKHQKK